jgi:uncharacterized protein (DUF934 family)
MHLIANNDHMTLTLASKTIKIANTEDPSSFSGQLGDVETIELDFPKFTDGRAFSQAYLLRRRLGFTGELRATGDVLIDQLVQMQRSGFSSAVLRDGQDAAHGAKLLVHYSGFYQGDAVGAAVPFKAQQPSAVEHAA